MIIVMSLSSLICVLRRPYGDIVQNFIQRLPQELVDRKLLLDPLDGAMNDYWAMRLNGSSHEDTYERRQDGSGAYLEGRGTHILVHQRGIRRVDSMPKTWFVIEHHGLDIPERDRWAILERQVQTCFVVVSSEAVSRITSHKYHCRCHQF